MNNIVTSWQITRLKITSWVGLTILISIGFFFGSFTGGFGSMFVMYLIYVYIHRQDAKLHELKWLNYLGLEGMARTQCDKALSVGSAVLKANCLKELYDPFCTGEQPKLCRTCNQPYSASSYNKIGHCVNLLSVFPHSPKDEPPPNNPFRWYWFTLNGYPCPPMDWPEQTPWLPDSAMSQTPVQAMKVEGRKYYEQHPNPLWDAGFGHPPAWYKLKTN